MAKTETVCHQREVCGELLATRIIGAQMVTVRISLALGVGEPKPVVWQTLSPEEAANLMALFVLAAPKWNEVIGAEKATLNPSPADS